MTDMMMLAIGATISIVGTILTLAVALLAVRFAYRFITSPASNQRGVMSSAPPSSSPPLNLSQTVANPSPADSSATSTPPLLPIGSSAPDNAKKARFDFGVPTGTGWFEGLISIAIWRPKTPAEGLEGAWWGVIFGIVLDALQVVPLLFPGPQKMVSGPDSYEGWEKPILLIGTAVAAAVMLGLGALLRRRAARWAGFLLLWGQFVAVIDLATPPYNFKYAGLIMLLVLILLAGITCRLIFIGLESASAIRRGVARDTEARKSWGKPPWVLTTLALVAAVSSTVAMALAPKLIQGASEPVNSAQTTEAPQPKSRGTAKPVIAALAESYSRTKTATPGDDGDLQTSEVAQRGVETTPDVWNTFASKSDPEWRRYPALALNAPTRMPKLDASSAEYRTRINEAAREGVNFGGTAHILQFGCGTECSVAMIIDLATGRIDDFPKGGEDYLELSLAFRPDSRLIRSTWVSTESGVTYCMGQAFVWEYGRVQAVGPQLRSRQPTDAGCPQDQA